MTITTPLRLPYAGASTVDDARGRIVAECPDAETAAALVQRVNGHALSWVASRIQRRHYTARHLLALRRQAHDLRRERDAALAELCAVRQLLAEAMAEHEGQGLADLVRGLLLEAERRLDEVIQLAGEIVAFESRPRGPIRRVALPE